MPLAEPRQPPRVLAPAVKRLQATDPTFPTITAHDLRHSAASLANQRRGQREGGAADARASMTLDVYADLFDADLDVVAVQLDTAIKTAADALRTPMRQSPHRWRW